MLSKKKIFQDINDYLKNHPEDCSSILSIVLEHMNAYDEAIKNQKNESASKAFEELLTLLISPNITEHDKAVAMVDAIIHNYPKGIRSCESKLDVKILNYFCDIYFKKEYDLFLSSWEGSKGYGKYIQNLYEYWLTKDMHKIKKQEKKDVNV